MDCRVMRLWVTSSSTSFLANTSSHIACSSALPNSCIACFSSLTNNRIACSSFPVLSINLSSSPSPPDSLYPPILSYPMTSPFYIPSEKLTAAKMLGALPKKMEDREKREEETIALQRKIVEQNVQMTGVLNQMTQG